MNELFEKLTEQLQANFEAENDLEERIYNIKMSRFYELFPNPVKQQEEIDWTLKIKKRVLAMRHRILENLQAETTKELHRISTKLRKANLQAA